MMLLGLVSPHIKREDVNLGYIKEEEWRLFENRKNGEDTFKLFPVNNITAVYMDLRIDRIDEKRITEFCINNKIPLFKRNVWNEFDKLFG